jgi:hypothetical protein
MFFYSFPDTHVRQVAIEWMSSVSSDDFVDYLPQLLEALKHETWSASPLAKLLLERSLECPRVSHSLYWLLAQSLPGQTPQVTKIQFQKIQKIQKIYKNQKNQKNQKKSKKIKKNQKKSKN